MFCGRRSALPAVLVNAGAELLESAGVITWVIERIGCQPGLSTQAQKSAAFARLPRGKNARIF
jgi:hypothetical protein